MQTLIGKKIGMTRVYDDAGVHVPVTVVQVGPCVVTQRKTDATDKYEAVQLGFEEQKESRMNKPEMGHFAKAGAAPQKILREVRVEADEEAKPGDILTDKEALELLRSYYAIPENQRRRLFDLARVLSEAA